MKHAHARRCPLKFSWPTPPLRVVLVEPEIPPNTGNIARTCAATGSPLHLIEPLGFQITNAQLKRAGLDYWDSVALAPHPHFDHFLETAGNPRCWLFTTGATRSLFEADFLPGDALVFGSETRGLSAELLARFPERHLAIPLRADHVRSLNLSTAAGIAIYEALRQLAQRDDAAFSHPPNSP
ncbi:MAG: tRNA (cytidine(34)-2'-O)-methyltransferase [Kiritimatiellae bacterium]|nr:tRNA (cytidine(34)-2'-O)-methyltransferase [Kiritimatiellia bacterium]